MRKRIALVLLIVLALIGLLFTRTTVTAEAVEPFSAQELELLLARGSARLRMRMSDNSGPFLGSALQDGRQVGTTSYFGRDAPCEIVVPSGKLTVSVWTSACRRREMQVTVIAGEEREVVFEP